MIAALVLALAAAPTDGDPQATFALGAAAYRRGDLDAAEAAWRELLEAELPRVERARLAYDLGHVAWRRELPLEAVAWFTSAVELDPRHPDAWHDLELARAAAELEPADRGDLRSTVRRLATALAQHEARWLALAGLAFLALALAFEALAGGRLARMLAALAALACLVALVPWLLHATRADDDELLCVRAPAARIVSEPRADLEPIGAWRAGERALRIDALPGWVRVETADGLVGWVPDDAALALVR